MDFCASIPPSPLPSALAFNLTHRFTQGEVELGIESLLKARESDPYLDPTKRLLYERLRGEPAPTLEPAVLDGAVARTRLVMDGKKRRKRSAKTQEEEEQGDNVREKAGSVQ